jgi:hypothetical protein
MGGIPPVSPERRKNEISRNGLTEFEPVDQCSRNLARRAEEWGGKGILLRTARAVS